MEGKVILLLACFLLVSLSFASAATLIGGKIYNSDFSETVAGADVQINCNDESEGVTSLSDGSYAVIFSEELCDNGSNVEVSATKDSLSGFANGTVNDDVADSWDVAVVNVPLIPEFGMIVGLSAVVGAIAVFFLVRRK